MCVCATAVWRLASQAQLFHRQQRTLKKYIADMHTVLKYEDVLGKVGLKLECRRTQNKCSKTEISQDLCAGLFFRKSVFLDVGNLL